MAWRRERSAFREEVEGTGLVQLEEDTAAVGSTCSPLLPT